MRLSGVASRAAATASSRSQPGILPAMSRSKDRTRSGALIAPDTYWNKTQNGGKYENMNTQNKPQLPHLSYCKCLESCFGGMVGENRVFHSLTFAIRLLNTEFSSTALLAFDAPPALPREIELLSPPPSPNSRSGETTRAGSSPERPRSRLVLHARPCR